MRLYTSDLSLQHPSEHNVLDVTFWVEKELRGIGGLMSGARSGGKIVVRVL